MSTTVDRVTTPVNASRRYRSVKRAEQAASTRHRLLAAGWTLFTDQGYAATTVTQVARAAGTSVDTLYAAIGRKPVLMRAVLESAISGTDETIPALQRDYVQRNQEDALHLRLNGFRSTEQIEVRCVMRSAA